MGLDWLLALGLLFLAGLAGLALGGMLYEAWQWLIKLLSKQK